MTLRSATYGLDPMIHSLKWVRAEKRDRESGYTVDISALILLALRDSLVSVPNERKAVTQIA